MDQALAGCREGVSYAAGDGGQMLLRPSDVLGAAEAALRNASSLPALEAASAHSRPLLSGYSDFVHFAVSACPPVLLAAQALEALMAHARYGAGGDSARLFFARAPRLAQHARGFVEERPGGAEAWRALLARRWPRLDAAPARLWRLAGCPDDGAAGLTLARLLLHVRRHEDLGACFAGPNLFSPRAYFAAHGERASPSELARAMYCNLIFCPVTLERSPQDFFWVHLLKLVLEEHFQATSSLRGLLLEFGAGGGFSSRAIGEHLQAVWRRGGAPGVPPRLFSFDSFQGLPRDWQGLDAGAFAPEGGGLPDVPDTVRFIVGWFNETVQPFLEGVRAGATAAGVEAPFVALAHIDADLYESTQMVLRELHPFLADGSILVFDDMLHSFDSASRSGQKENWDALFEALRSEAWQRWDLEVLAAPWSPARVGQAYDMLAPDAVAFRLRAAA